MISISIRKVILITGGLALLGVVVFGFPSSGLTDLDQDTYVGVQFGGNDCVDSLQSAFMSNQTNCRSDVQPTFVTTGRPSPDRDIADHTWVQDLSGTYHLFLQNEDKGSGDFIQHYATPALGQALTYIGPAIQQTPDGWDSYGMWAPHVVKNPVDGLYYMFYAGVTPGGAQAKQRIGVATSSDLTTWSKAPVNFCDGTTGDGCVYECQADWTEWGRGTDYDDQCRDPMIIWDPANSRWLMFATARSMVSTIDSQLVTVAESIDLLHWTDAGYIKATRRIPASEGGVGGQPTGWVAENPFVTEYDGEYYLFFTDSSDPEDYWNVPNPRTEIQYVSSPTLDVDTNGSVNWTYRGYTHDPGVNAAEIQAVSGDTWIVSHSIVPNPYSGYWYSHRRDLRLKRIVWGDDGSFTTSNLINPACRVPSESINPGQTEVCADGLDNDCNGQTDDPALCGICVDLDDDGYGTTGSRQCAHPEIDCDDANINVHPGATEYCSDSVDNNCNNQIDEEDCSIPCIDLDNDGYGAQGSPECWYPETDCNDNDDNTNPDARELCGNGVDNNCNGIIDDPVICDPCVDVDHDGYGVSGFAQCTNAQPDCNDNNASLHPNAVELCDRVDNNCNTQIDEGETCRSRKIRWTMCDAGDESESVMTRACYVYY